MASMYMNIKKRVELAVSSSTAPSLGDSSNSSFLRQSNRNLPHKFKYGRPPFLQLWTADELKASADHNVRPIIVPRDIEVLPFNTGYAECVNSGKSEWNEDQASFCRKVISHPSQPHSDLPYTYFGIFDGHAGVGAALAASNQFHHILHEKLVDIIEMLLPKNDLVFDTGIKKHSVFPYPISFHKTVTKDELIIGALESAFAEMDAMLAEDRNKYRNAGGCTALVTLFIGGKMFVSNAGDSRAVLCQRMSNEVLKNHAHSSLGGVEEKTLKDKDDKHMHIFPIAFSHDHTPDTERPRLMSTGKLNPSLMGDEYVAMEYSKRPNRRDLGQRILYREGTMKGWAYKTVTKEDLKMPLVTGEGKRSRLLGTIGVTRGFGDHDLRALCSKILIKPFLSPHPDVNYRDLTKVISIPDENNEDGDYGVLIMATDGLWDVADPEGVSATVFKTLAKFPTEKHRYTMVAQELVAKSRGRINDAGHWRLAESEAAATVDDISVLVIPVYQYYKEWVEWEKKCEEKRKQEIEKEKNKAHSSDDSFSVESAQLAMENETETIFESLKVNEMESTTEEVKEERIEADGE